MKIILLSGALKNSGDFLITERCSNILRHVYPKANIKKIVGNYPLNEKLSEVNRADVMVIAGGPSYTKNLYPKDVPLTGDLEQIHCKLFIMGSGWYGNLTNDKELYKYKFKNSSKSLLNRISCDTERLGCRDYYSIRIFQSNGFRNGIMTGCPAWYDLDNLSKRLSFKKGINKILVSDPADVRSFYSQSIAVVRYLRQKYPSANIEYIFHRGTKADNLTSSTDEKYIKKIILELNKMGISHYDISYGYKGFHLYDDCDLHIGHRVHAHIYNLSQRKISILIEEDSRGAGVNEALGLWGIKGYQWKLSSNANSALKIVNQFISLTQSNPYVIKDIENYLQYIFDTKADLFNIAYGNMEYYFSKMVQHVSSIKEFI